MHKLKGENILTSHDARSENAFKNMKYSQKMDKFDNDAIKFSSTAVMRRPATAM